MIGPLPLTGPWIEMLCWIGDWFGMEIVTGPGLAVALPNRKARAPEGSGGGGGGRGGGGRGGEGGGGGAGGGGGVGGVAALLGGGLVLVLVAADGREQPGVLTRLAGHLAHIGGHVASVVAADEVHGHDAAAPWVADLIADYPLDHAVAEAVLARVLEGGVEVRALVPLGPGVLQGVAAAARCLADEEFLAVDEVRRAAPAARQRDRREGNHRGRPPRRSMEAPTQGAA